MKLVVVLALLLASLAFAKVVVFSDGSGYVLLSNTGFSVYSIDGRFLYTGPGPAYVGPTCIAFYTGSGVSIVDFRGALKAFYPLNFTPTVLASDCRVVVTANQTVGVYISPSLAYSFKIGAAPYSAAVLNGVGYILDLNGDVVSAGPNGVSITHIGGYPAGMESSPDCVVASVVKSGTQYFYRVDVNPPSLLASEPARVGLAYPFAVGLGCRLLLAPRDKGTAAAADGPYAIYGTSTGYVEVYLGDELVYEKYVGAPVLSVSSAGLNIAYQTPQGVGTLILVNETLISNCGNKSILVEAGQLRPAPAVIQFPNGTRCVLAANYTVSSAIYATYKRQYFVVLNSPQPFSGWLDAGSAVPPPPPIALDYVELVPRGWAVGGSLYSSLAVDGPLTASAEYEVVPLVNGTLGNGTAVRVVVSTPVVVWPQRPSYVVERYYYVAAQPPAYVVGGNGYYRAGSPVTIAVELPSAPAGCRYVFSGWVGLNATAPNVTVVVARPIYAAPQLVEECQVVLYTKYGSVVNAPGWVPVGTVVSPTVAPSAVWAPFPLRYVFVGWDVNGVVSTQFAVSGPVYATAVWVLDPTPLVAIAAALAAAVGLLLWLKRRISPRSSARRTG